MFEESIFSEREITKAKAKFIQIPTTNREKWFIQRGLYALGYTGTLSSSIRELIMLYVNNRLDRIPPPTVDLEEINAMELNDAFIVIRCSTHFKEYLKNSYKTTHRGERDYILSILRLALRYAVQEDGSIARFGI